MSKDGLLAYNRQMKAATQDLLQEVKSGKRTAESAMKIAQEMRNSLMELIRTTRTSEPVLAYVRSKKREGKTLTWPLNKYSQEIYGMDFEKLKTQSRKNNVYLEIVRAAGRPNFKENALAKNLGRAGKFLFVLSIAISVYTVSIADDKALEAANQSAILGGGMIGSVVGGAAAGTICAATSVICVGAFIVIFGFGAAATASDVAFDKAFR